MPVREITESEAEMLAMARAARPQNAKLEWGYDENGEWCILEIGEGIPCTGTALEVDQFDVRRQSTGRRGTRYWVIAPVGSYPPTRYDAVWRADLANSCITIGWHELGDVSRSSREDLVEIIERTYPDTTPGARGLFVNMIRNFFHEIQIGDVVLARRGLKVLEAVGVVRSPARYTERLPGDFPETHTHRFVLDVAWAGQPRSLVYDSVVFKMQTLSEASLGEYRALMQFAGAVETTLSAANTETPQAGEVAATFDMSGKILEKYLEEFMVANFRSIFQGKLSVYEDTEINEGQQFQTDVGRIDILAVDEESGGYVVIELKKGQTSDQVVGQTLRYMGWVKSHLCKAGTKVRGLIICQSADAKLKYALSATENIALKTFQLDFKLSEA